MLTILLAVLAAATNAAASVLQRKGNLREVRARRTGVAGLADLLRQPPWLGGIGAVIVSFLLQAGALATGELAEVQPLMALELPLTLLLASLTFRHRLGRRTWLEIGVMTGGIALFLISLRPTGGAPGSPGAVAWGWGAGGTGALIAALAALAYISPRPRRAGLLGVAAGVAFALTAAFMSAALARGVTWSIFQRWPTYLTAVAGITAMVLLQEGLQAGSLVVVQPGLTLSDPVVAVVLGVLLFREAVRTGIWIAPEAIGGLAVAWGVVQLSRPSAAGAEQARDRAAQRREPSEPHRREIRSDAPDGG